MEMSQAIIQEYSKEYFQPKISRKIRNYVQPGLEKQYSYKKGAVTQTCLIGSYHVEYCARQQKIQIMSQIVAKKERATVLVSWKKKNN